MLRIDENLIIKSQNLSVSALEFENKLVFMYTKDELKILTKVLTEQVLKHNQDKSKEALL